MYTYEASSRIHLPVYTMTNTILTSASERPLDLQSSLSYTHANCAAIIPLAISHSVSFGLPFLVSAKRSSFLLFAKAACKPTPKARVQLRQRQAQAGSWKLQVELYMSDESKLTVRV